MHIDDGSASVTSKPMTLGLLLAACLAGGGCGQDVAAERDVAGRSRCVAVEEDVLRSVRSDYEQAPSLPAAPSRQDPDLVVTGEVVRFSNGPEMPVEGDPGHPSRYVVMEVRVTSVEHAKSQALISEGSVFVPVPQGPVLAGTGAPALTPADFDAAIPPATRVALALGPASPWVEDPTSAVTSEGAPLAAAGLQGFLIDDCGELVGGFEEKAATQAWREIDSIHAFVEAVRDWSAETPREGLDTAQRR